MESGCYHSGQLFTTVHTKIFEAQVCPTQLFETHELMRIKYDQVV